MGFHRSFIKNISCCFGIIFYWSHHFFFNSLSKEIDKVFSAFSVLVLYR